MTATALLRRIERENEAKRQEAWAERAAGLKHGTKARPKWAVDHLLAVGEITPGQHSAAQRYWRAIEGAQVGAGAGNWQKVDGARPDPHEKMWNASVALQEAREARLYVATAPSSRPTRLRVLDRLFAFNGHVVTGALPTMAKMRHSPSGVKSALDPTVAKIAHVLELLEGYFDKLQD